jgi:NADH-quinone oxidoreductase subunit N
MMNVGPSSFHVLVGLLWLPGVCITAFELKFPRWQGVGFSVSILVILASLSLGLMYWPGDGSRLLLGGGMKLDAIALFSQYIVGVVCLFALFFGRHLRIRLQSNGLILLSMAGMLVLSMSIDFVGMLTGLVAAVIPLLGLMVISSNRYGREAALKGLICYVLAAALMGLGTILLASRVGTTTFDGLSEFLRALTWVGDEPMIVVSIALLLSGLGLFLAVVPFHMGFVDVIQGSPIPVALVLTGGLFGVGLISLCRFVLLGLAPVVDSGPGYLSYVEVFRVVGLAALIVGHSMALVQRRLKRLLAYLAVGQAGLLLVGLAAASLVGHSDSSGLGQGLTGLLVFVFVQSINWAGLYLPIAAVSEVPGTSLDVGRLDGLAQKHPWLSAAIGLALLCMAGMPLTAGFFSRLYLLKTMLAAGWLNTTLAVAVSLALVLVLSLRLLTAMVLRSPNPTSKVHRTRWLVLVAWICSLAILVLGALPGGILKLASVAAASFTKL